MAAPKDEVIKEEILSAAQKLFRQFGLRKTTMEDIAKNISKGKSTLYYYYCSKDEIFDAVVRKELEEVFGKTIAAVDRAKCAGEKLRIYLVTKMDTLRRKSNLYRMVRLEMLENPPCYHHIHQELEQREIGLVTQILLSGVASGEFDSRVLHQIDVLPVVIIGSLKAFEFDLFIGNGHGNLEPAMDAVIDLLLNGIKNSTCVPA